MASSLAHASLLLGGSARASTTPFPAPARFFLPVPFSFPTPLRVLRCPWRPRRRDPEGGGGPALWGARGRLAGGRGAAQGLLEQPAASTGVAAPRAGSRAISRPRSMTSVGRRFDDGTVGLLDRGFRLSYVYQAYASSVLFLQQLKEFNIEKLQLVEAEKNNIRQEHERKEKQVEVRKKMG